MLFLITNSALETLVFLNSFNFIVVFLLYFKLRKVKTKLYKSRDKLGMERSFYDHLIIDLYIIKKWLMNSFHPLLDYYSFLLSYTNN